MTGVCGVLLTGGASKRMGTAKATLTVDGQSWACRAAALLIEVTDLAVEVGPGWTDLDVAQEDQPGEGPLPALIAGWSTLRRSSHDGPVIVLACDLPWLTGDALRFLATWPGARSVAPVLDGSPQPLCARWSPAALEAAAARVAAGGRRVRGLLEADGATLLDESWWSPRFGSDAFADADTPEDLARLGLAKS